MTTIVDSKLMQTKNKFSKMRKPSLRLHRQCCMYLLFTCSVSTQEDQSSTFYRVLKSARSLTIRLPTTQSKQLSGCVYLRNHSVRVCSLRKQSILGAVSYLLITEKDTCNRFVKTWHWANTSSRGAVRRIQSDLWEDNPSFIAEQFLPRG